MENKLAVICNKVNQNLILFLGQEIGSDDILMPVTLNKYPSINLEKIFFEVKKKYDYLVLVNNTNYYSRGLIKYFKKYATENGIIFAKNNDIFLENGLLQIDKKLIFPDDTVCIPLKRFRGFRDFSPSSKYLHIIVSLSAQHNIYSDISRCTFGYKDLIDKKTSAQNNFEDVDENFYKSELIFLKKKEHDLLLQSNLYKKVNSNGNIEIIQGVNLEENTTTKYSDYHNSWMLD